jgi:hypothetical protein
MKRQSFILSLLCLSGVSALLAADAGAVSPTAVDTRMSITVTEAERNQILYEMRAFLHGLHNVHVAMGRKDMKAVALEAGELGKTLDRIPAQLLDRMPQPFTEMRVAMYETFKYIARDVEGKADPALTHQRFAEALSYCSGCHDTYRFQIGKVPR